MDLFQVNDDIRRMSGKEMMAYFGVDGMPMSSPKPETSQPSSRFDVGGDRAQDFEPVDYSDFREKYGLEFDEEDSKLKPPGKYSSGSGGDGYATDDGAIFTADGVYVGTAKGSKNDDGEITYDNYDRLASDASGIKKEAEGKGFSDFSSLSDVAGAVYWLTKDDKKEDTAKEEEEEPYFPIKTPEVAKAAARTKSFSKNVRPNYGTLLFGDPEERAGVLDKFKKDSNKFFKRDPIFDYESYKTEQDMLRDERQGERALNRRDNDKPFDITKLPKGIDRFAEFKSQFN